MKKFKMKLTNCVSSGVWCRHRLTHLGNITTNSVITPAMFKRECAEYDVGVLPTEHDMYIGERYDMSVVS